jgi:DNA replication and repair protein RecF
VYLSQLHLSNFRSYTSLDLELSPGTTILVGSNGYGKTNIVEAVQYLATLGSHRVSSDQPLIRRGSDIATIGARVHAGIGDDRCLSLAIDLRSGAANRALLNKAPVRPRELRGAVRTIFFAPEDLAIVQGDPSERRQFIDELIVSRWPRLAGIRSEYDRALKQKTALLKAISGRSLRGAGGGAEETVAVWDEEIAKLGAEIVAARLRTLSDSEDMVARHYSTIAPKSNLASVSYHSSAVAHDSQADADFLRITLAEAIAMRKSEEIARGVCLVGPHRDDCSLSLGDLPVRGYASHGESWSFALALRLASLDLLREDGVEPILILDDVFAELDKSRRLAVVAAIDSVEQAFITVAVPHDLPQNLEGSVYEVTPGTVVKKEV